MESAVSDVAIVFAVISVAVVLFVWNKIPPVIVGVGVSLALFFTGILSTNEALAGFGDPTIVLIASLFVVAAGLEVSGVTTWAGKLLVEKSAGSVTRAFVLLMLLTAVATATISVNGTVAALMPVVIVVAVRLGVPTSQLLIPLCFASHSATMLTLLGAPLNVLGSQTAKDAGYGGIGFFEFAVAGVPMLIGSMAIMLLTRRFLLPHRNGESLPADFSAHAQTLVEQYQLEDGLHRLQVRPSSPYVGVPRGDLDLRAYSGLSFVAIQDSESSKPLQRDAVAAGDVLLVRGDKDMAGRLAVDRHLAFRLGGSEGVAETLFNKGSGLAEVVIPPRSKLIGQTAFAGMSARDGDLIVLAVQRGGENIGAGPATLAVGDHLLLQGTWHALEKHLADPQVLVVDSPEVVRRQAVSLGHRAWEAIAVLVALIILLVGGWFPAALAALVCAVALVLLRVLTIPQVYKGIDWNTCILIGGMMPLATAMSKTGTAQVIADGLIHLVGDAGPRALIAGLFVVTLAFGQLMSNTAIALVMLPIAAATGTETGISPMPLIIATIIASHAALFTPIATPVNLMVLGPGGYRFGDYWKFGFPLAAWWLVVALTVVPLYWRF
jgi:di/tricarboxylate transporter